MDGERMPEITGFRKVDAEHLADSLIEAREQLDSVTGETVLDFSAVHRIDASALRALQELARAADERNVKIGLRAVNVDIYKVLKLMSLAPRFSFMS